MSSPALRAAFAVLEADPEAPADRVTEAYEAALSAEPGRRRTGGIFYTPTRVVDILLDLTLEPVLAATPADTLPALRVGDPTCGAGHLLLGAWARITRRLHAAGVHDAARRAVACLVGTDVDPDALALADRLLRRAAGAPADLRVGDALLDPGPRLDVVLGNPPFLNQLQRPTAQSRSRAALLKDRYPGVVQAYTDPAWLHLLAALRRLRPGGRLGLLQPRSVLGARDAAGIRAALAAEGCVRTLWDGGAAFPGVGVEVVALVVDKAPPDARPVHVWTGLPARPGPPAPLPPATGWAALLPPPPDLPRVPAALLAQPGAGTLAPLVHTAADFRDEYYGLVPHVLEGPLPAAAFPPLVTTGLVEAAGLAWGARPTRFGRRTWQRPQVDRDALAADPRMATWAGRRLRPKILLATQTRALEAVVDEHGAWLTVTPLISVYPRAPGDLWRVAAVLLSPVATSWAAEHHGGAALTRDTLKLSARQVCGIPTPPPGPAWDRAADAVCAAHHDPTRRLEHLAHAGRQLLAAWGHPDEALFAGWWARVHPAPRRSRETG